MIHSQNDYVVLRKEFRLVTNMSVDHPALPEAHPKQSEGDRYFVLLDLIERHLGRIANVLEALSPEPAQFVKGLGAVRTVPKPKNR